MGLIACPVPGKAKSKMLCDAFIKGAPKSAEGRVFYGVKAGNYREWTIARNSGEPFWFIDNSMFDLLRGVTYRVTKNALQHTGDGECAVDHVTNCRFRIEPWRDPAAPGRVLVVEQSQDHMRYTLRGDQWLHSALRAYAGSDIHWRRWSAGKPKIQQTLARDLATTKVLVTHNSAAAVMAVLAGVPVDCAPECAAFCMNGASDADRLRWANVLMDNEFSIRQLKDGTAWRKLNP